MFVLFSSHTLLYVVLTCFYSVKMKSWFLPATLVVKVTKGNKMKTCPIIYILPSLYSDSLSKTCFSFKEGTFLPKDKDK